MTQCDNFVARARRIQGNQNMADHIDAKKQLGAKIKFFRKKLNMTQPELAAKCGWLEGSAQSRISHYERGVREPMLSDILRIAEALSIEAYELLRFVPTLNEKGIEIHSMAQNVRKIPQIEWQDIPRFLKSHPLDFSSKHLEVDDTVSLNSFSLIVKGDSMQAPDASRSSLYDGDAVIIDRSKSPAPFDTVLVSIDNENWLRLYIPHGNHIELRPLNKDYKSIKLNSNTEILGVVVERRRK